MKTKIFHFTVIALLCLDAQVSAQNTNLSAQVLPGNLNKDAAAKPLTRNASFPGLGKFLSDSLQYPELARKNGIEGTVVVEVTVGTNGNVVMANIIEKVGFGCDEAVLSLFSEMPKWEPAHARGKPVEQKVLVPVRFRLQ